LTASFSYLQAGNSLAFCKAVKSPFIPLFQRGKKWKEFSIESPKALLPLKKGGREGFLARPFQSAKVLPKLKLPIEDLDGGQRIFLIKRQEEVSRKGKVGDVHKFINC